MKPVIRTLFGELSDLRREEREEYYASRKVPAEIRREVESLLAHDAGRPIGSVVQAAVGMAFREPVADGDSFGPFRLLREIGCRPARRVGPRRIEASRAGRLVEGQADRSKRR